MPIFESNGKKYNVQDVHIENFKAEHPDATTVLEREGKKFRVKVGDYGKFVQGVPAAPAAPRAEKVKPAVPETEADKSSFTFTAEELGLNEKKSRVRQKWEAQKAERNKEDEEGAAEFNLTDEDRERMEMGAKPMEEDPYKANYEKAKAAGETMDFESWLQSLPNAYSREDAVDANGELKAFIPKERIKSEEYGGLSREQAELLRNAGYSDDVDAVKALNKTDVRNQINDSFAEITDAWNTVKGNVNEEYYGDRWYGKPLQAVNKAFFNTDATDFSLDKGVQSLRAADKLIGEAKDVMDAAVEKKGFFAGTGEALAKWNPVKSLEGLVDADAVEAVVKKIEEGKELSTAESALLDAFALNAAAHTYYDDEVSNWYNAGKVVGDMIPLAAEMVANPASGMARKWAQATLKRVAGKSLSKATKKALIYAAGAGGAFAGGAITAGTTGLPSVLEEAQKNTTGQAQFGIKKSGEVGLTGVKEGGSFGEEFLKSLYRRGVENATEQMGAEWLTKWLGGVAGKAVKAIPGGKKAVEYVTDLVDNKYAHYLKELADKVNYQGPIEEFVEEIESAVLGTPVDGFESLKEFFEGDNLITTAIAVSVPGFGMGTVNALGGALSGQYKVGFRENQKRMQAYGRGVEAFGGDQNAWNKLAFAINTASKDGVEAELKRIYSSPDYTPEQKQRALEYAVHALKYRTAVEANMAMSDETTKMLNEMLGGRYNAGYNATDDVAPQIKRDYDMVRDRAVQTLGEDVVAALDNDPVGTLMGMNEIDLVEAMDYVNARVRYEGMIDRISDDIDEHIKVSNREIDSHVNKADGMIHPATLRTNGRKVYIVSGNVAQFEDKTIDKANSSDFILVRDAETGEVKAASVDEFDIIDEVIDPAVEKQAVADAITNQVATEKAAIIEGESGKVETESEVQPVVAPASGGNVSPVETAAPVIDKKARRTELEKMIPVKGKKKQFTEVEPAVTAEYISLLTDDVAKQVAAADKYIALIQEAQQKADPVEALEMDEQIAYWESVKALLQTESGEAVPVVEETLAPVVESTPVAEVETPQATNEMQEVGETVVKPVKKVRGRKQVEVAIGKMRKADAEGNAIEALNQAFIAEKNAKLGDEGAITPEELAEIDALKKKYAEQGYEVEDMTGKEYDEGMRLEAEFVIDESLPDGAAVIKSTQKPYIFKDGVLVQKAKVIVAQSPVKVEDGEVKPTISQTSDQVGDQVIDHYTLNSAGNSTQMLKDMEAVRKSNREEYGKISPAYELFYKAKERGLYPNELEELRDIVKGTSLEGKVDGWFTPVMAEGGNAPGQSGVVDNNSANALQNGNNELNLQKENESYNESNQNDIPVGGQVSQSVSQGEHGEVASLSGGAQETAARLREGIESTQGDPKSGLREVENRVTREFALENGLWIEDETKLGIPFPSGDEHNNYIDAENQVIYKVNNRMHTPSILGLLDRMELHNKYFPNTQYRLVGFTSVSENGDVMPVFAQDFVPDARMATVEEIDSYMGALGFTRVGDGRYSNGEVVIKDLKPRNVLVNHNGDVFVVDAEFEQEKAQKGGDVKDVSEETTQAENEVAKQEDKDVAAFDKQAEIAKEREQRAGVAPRPGHLAVAIGEGNEKAVEEWKAKFDSYLQKLNADDLPTIDATIKGMQGRKKDIRKMNKDGYKDNSNYKAYDYIETVLKKRAAELKKVSATEQPKQEKASQGERSKGKTESESKQEVEKIEDVGEVLAGARKDALKVLASSFENATVKSLIELPFSKAFKKPDPKKAVESGALREKDALFYEAMFNALINSSKPKNSARHRNAVETWAEETYNSLQLIKSFVEADEAARDRAMAEALDDKFPARAEELAVIEKRKVWNARNNAEWGDKTTPNPVWVAHEVLKALGYKPGDKVEIPFGVLKANVFATGYEFYNKKGERLIMQSVPTVEEGIENIVWLSKIKRGDADTMHPVSSFFATPTKRDMGDSGRYYVLWGTVRNPRRSEFGSIEEANAFAAGHKEAVVRPIQEVVKRYGYKLVFREPITGDKFFVNDMEFETEGEAMQYLEDNYDAVNEQTNELLAKERGEAKKEVSADDLLEVAMVRGKEGWKYAVNIKGKYANNMGMPLLLREFDTREDAKAFLNESKNEVFEIYKKQQAEQKKFVFFDTGENSRIGEDYRGGRDVTAKDFMDTFGFRGVQFGNWTNQEDRQMAVNQAFDAFMDLAKLLGVSPKALSLNGELGMAFGSRGSGFGNAHYELGEIVINLTKTRGAGSLAHEWWHALDNYFARRANVPMGMVTDSRSIDMRPELRQAYNELLKMIEKSDFYKRSKAKGDYWGRMHEVTARLMAEWVDQSLKDRGELNTFLSRGVNEDKYKRMNYDVHRAVALIKGKEALSYEEFEKTPEALAGFPYPSRAELKEFGDAMRNIFETVEEQETEEGDVVLYRSSEGTQRKFNKHAEEFNKTHKGGIPVVDIDPNNMEAELAEEGFTAEVIQDLIEKVKKGAKAFFDSDRNLIYLLDPSLSEEDIHSLCWHEDTHVAVAELALAPELKDEFYSYAKGRKKEKIETYLAKIGYKKEDYPEEFIAYSVQGMGLLGIWDASALSKITGSTAEGAQRQMEIIQPLIDYINNGQQGREGNRGSRGSLEGDVQESGMYDTTVQKTSRKAETERTGSLETTGGLTEEEIATIEAATGYTRDEIIEIFGGDLNRQGNGPLTDREVMMESDPYSKELGKPRYYGKRQREFVARQRRRMAEKARQVAEKLNLDNVEVLESTEGLTGKKATSKGWFDPRTGKITVVVPNHGSTGDIVETVLHEAVAHHGLRKLFGENFKNFLDNVYRNVTPEIRAEITELAKKHGWDFHTATEEYLASLAENTNFEKVNPSLWSNIKSFFMKMLAKVGITLDEPLGDNELRYILWRSHQNLVNPGWFNVFGQAEDIAKQYELGVGNYQTENGKRKAESVEVAAEDDSALLHREGGAPGSAREEYERKVRRPNKSGSVGATENVARRAQEAYQDSMLALKILQDAVAKETGNEVKDNENAYIAENRMSSSNKAMVEIYERDFFMPLMDEINALIKEGVEYDDIIRYLHAKHGLERNEYMRRKQAEEAARRELGEEPAMPNEGDADYEAKVNAKAAWRANLVELTESYVKKFAKRDYSGLTALTESANAKAAEAAAQQMVDEFENDHDTTPLWEAVNKATKETLRREFVGGLIDRATYDTVSTMFDFYIPLRGWDENVAANEYEYFANNNTPVFTPAIKTMHGRKSLSDDPIATIGYMAGSAIARANRNLMKQKFLNFVMNNPTSLATVSEQWYTMDYGTNEWVPNNPAIPEDATPEQVVEIVEAHEANMRALEKAGKATRERSGLKIGLHATKQEEQQHVVRVMRNGKEYAVYINGNPRAAQALNGMTNPDVSKSKAREAAQKVKNFMARAFTSRNPAFIISNSVRDVIWAGTAVAAKENVEYTKQYTKNVTGVLAKLKLPRLLRKFQKGTLDMNNEIERYFDEFLRNGGETGFTQVLTVEDYKKNIARFTKEAKNGTRISKKAWRGLWNGIEFLNRSAEDITRFTVYMTSRQMGRSIARSVYDAKEITVNFNKKGSGEIGARYLNFAYIFFNATIQSLANFGKLMARHPGKMAAALGTFGMMGFLMPVINAALMALGDDDDEENYWNLPEWVRRNNIVLFVPWTEKGFITIPLPHEIRPFYGMGENAMSALLGKQTTEDAIKKSLVGFTGMLPIDFTANGATESKTPIDLLIRTGVNLTPTSLQPAAQVLANVTHFGTPIYKDNDFNKRYPSWTKAYKGTNSTLVAATKWLNELGGGNNVDSGGLLDWNPAVIEHLFESYLGGMGKTFNKTATTVSMLWDEDARIARNIPVASSFYQESDERTAGSQLNREYFDALEEMEGFQYRLSGYQKEITKGNAEYKKLFEDLVNSDEFMRYRTIKNYSNAISELNHVLKNNGPTEEKAQEIEGVIQKLKNEMLDKLEKLQAEE